MTHSTPFLRRWIPVLASALALTAAVGCTTAATPEVVRDMSRANTQTQAARPTLAPTGPTLTPSASPTPFARPTDPPSLDLNLPIVRIGDETITLGLFRARVRYERFKALNNARRAIETVGLERFNFAMADGSDRLVSNVAAIFNTLSNSGGFGRTIYDVMVRESVIRQEYTKRGLSIAPGMMDGWWKRELELQRDPDADSKLSGLKDFYMNAATAYSGLTREQIERLAEANQIATEFRIEFAKTVKLPSPITYRIERLTLKSNADADAAYQAISAGAPYREVVCRYSIDPQQVGKRGSLGLVGRNQLTPGLNGVDTLFAAEPGAIVGPLNSPLGWHVYRINSKSQDADGNAQLDLSMIQVAAESLATQLTERIKSGTSFEELACGYSLDPSAGVPGYTVAAHPEDLPLNSRNALGNFKEPSGLLPLVEVGDGTFDVIKLLERQVSVPKPEDVDAEVTRQYEAWQKEQAASSLVTSLSESWKDAIPGDPLPRDVATFMNEENFGLPTLAPSPSVTLSPTAAATP